MEGDGEKAWLAQSRIGVTGFNVHPGAEIDLLWFRGALKRPTEGLGDTEDPEHRFSTWHVLIKLNDYLGSRKYGCAFITETIIVSDMPKDAKCTSSKPLQVRVDRTGVGEVDIGNVSIGLVTFCFEGRCIAWCISRSAFHAVFYTGGPCITVHSSGRSENVRNWL